jgi:hypothetical protein
VINSKILSSLRASPPENLNSASLSFTTISLLVNSYLFQLLSSGGIQARISSDFNIYWILRVGSDHFKRGILSCAPIRLLIHFQLLPKEHPVGFY